MLPGIKKVWRLIKSASKVSQTIIENSLMVNEQILIYYVVQGKSMKQSGII